MLQILRTRDSRLVVHKHRARRVPTDSVPILFPAMSEQEAATLLRTTSEPPDLPTLPNSPMLFPNLRLTNLWCCNLHSPSANAGAGLRIRFPRKTFANQRHHPLRPCNPTERKPLSVSPKRTSPSRH